VPSSHRTACSTSNSCWEQWKTMHPSFASSEDGNHLTDRNNLKKQLQAQRAHQAHQQAIPAYSNPPAAMLRPQYLQPAGTTKKEKERQRKVGKDRQTERKVAEAKEALEKAMAAMAE
jgi:hypothetical protein